MISGMKVGPGVFGTLTLLGDLYQIEMAIDQMINEISHKPTASLPTVSILPDIREITQTAFLGHSVSFLFRVDHRMSLELTNATILWPTLPNQT